MSRALFALVVLCALSSGACSAVIGGRPSPDELLPCWIEGGFDPCPSGTRCAPDPSLVSGRCVPMCIAGANEVCNGYDDDCDELVDEPDAATLCPTGAYCLDGTCLAACQVDGDMDGYATCPMPGMAADCDDERADINPMAREVCDGIDNDCNPATSDSLTGICMAGETCTTPRGEMTPRCIRPDCSNFIDCDATEVCNPETGDCEPMTTDCRTGTSTCSATERCDPGSGVCVQLRDLGTSCTADVQCSSERCVAYSALMLQPDASGGTGLCASACCRDLDCPDGFRCWAPGTGARACVPAARVPLDGSIHACSATGTCPGEICDGRSVPTTTGGNVGMFLCTAGSPMSTTDVCYSTSDCSEGFCFRPSTIFGTYPEGWCGLPCRTSRDCDYPIDPFVGLVAGDRACRYVPVTTGERLQACMDVGSAGAGENGAICGGPGDCRDAFCLGTRCSGICCADGDCGATEVCAPVNRGGWEMRCIPRFGP